MTDFLIAYWLHSTVLLAAAWCLMKLARHRSSVVRERLWKLAAVLPVLTALTSVGFRSAKAVPVAERQMTIVEAIASPIAAELASDDSVDRVVAQAESANDPVVRIENRGDEMPSRHRHREDRPHLTHPHTLASPTLGGRT